MQYQGFLNYNVDIVLCIDATGSMQPHIDRVKDHALKLHSDIIDALKVVKKPISQIRVRVIAFRDYYADTEAMISSPFYKLPDQAVEFKNFVSGIVANGGADDPESGYEALALAMKSDWLKEGGKRRQIVVLFTDAAAHPLEKKPKPAGYPAGIPCSFDEMTSLWQGQSSPMHQTFKRLILFAPDDKSWNDISENWNLVVHHAATAAEGLADIDYKTILAAIANSV